MCRQNPEGIKEASRINISTRVEGITKIKPLRWKELAVFETLCGRNWGAGGEEVGN